MATEKEARDQLAEDLELEPGAEHGKHAKAAVRGDMAAEAVHGAKKARDEIAKKKGGKR